MNFSSYNEGLFSFIQQSTSPFHAARTMAAAFAQSGYQRLEEDHTFPAPLTGRYYLCREDGTLVAFHIGSQQDQGFRIVAVHSDSPSLQIKPQPDQLERGYQRLGVEIYGSPLLHTWFDRELSLAGRLNYADYQGNIHGVLFDSKRAVALIPSLALHLDRNANKEKRINTQKDIIPLIGLGSGNPFDLKSFLLEKVNSSSDTEAKALLAFDLFLYDASPPGYCGVTDDFIIAGRLDNLMSCYVATCAMKDCTSRHNIMFVCSNHEEIGSTSRSGAQGNFFRSLFERIFPDTDRRYKFLAHSHLISLDNAHAIHPNFSDKSDPSHDVFLNHGPVIKINSAQRYASTSYSRSIFQFLAQEAKVPTQDFVMRNDMACGSTIGPLLAAQLGISTVDVGIPTLAMHSIREVTGRKDPLLMHRVISHFLNREYLPSTSTAI